MFFGECLYFFFRHVNLVCVCVLEKQEKCWFLLKLHTSRPAVLYMYGYMCVCVCVCVCVCYHSQIRSVSGPLLKCKRVPSLPATCSGN